MATVFTKMMINSAAVENVHLKDSQQEGERCCWSIRSSNIQHEGLLSKVWLMQKVSLKPKHWSSFLQNNSL